MRIAEVESYVARIPSYGLLSSAFLGLDAPALAHWLVTELERGGAIRIDEGSILPTMAA